MRQIAAPSAAYDAQAVGAPRRVVSNCASSVASRCASLPAGAPVDELSDLFAVGAIAYHLFAGESPYRGSTVKDHYSSQLDP